MVIATINLMVQIFIKVKENCGLRSTTRPGVSSCPPGCKIYPQNSKVSIDQNFASYNNKAVVETIKL